MESLTKFCEQRVFQLLHPSKIHDQLGMHLSLIDGGAGTLKTTQEGVQKVREHLWRKTRVLCDAPTVVARQNLVRALYEAFPRQVRVVGQSRLSPLEASLTLNALIRSDMGETRLGMLSLCQEFNNNVAGYLRAMKICQTAGAESLVTKSSESKCLICDQHDEFIKARENLEAIEYMYRTDVIAATPIVIGTSGVFMKSNLQSKHNLGEQFGALLTDESSMPEGGEEVCKMMNLLQKG